MIIICQDCKKPFEHIVVHKYTKSKKFCEPCIAIRHKTFYGNYKTMRVNPVVIPVEKVKDGSLWESSDDYYERGAI